MLGLDARLSSQRSGVQKIHDLLETAKSKKLSWVRKFHIYRQRFQWPRGYATGSQLCSKPGHTPNGSASEYISAAHVLARLILAKVGTPGLDERIVSCLSLCKILDLLAMSNSGNVIPEMLGDAMAKHLSLQQRALRTRVWIPKSHWVTHLPRQMARHGCLVSTFLMERKKPRFETLCGRPTQH